MNKAQWFFMGLISCVMIMACMAMVRYPVGQPVPSEIYTQPFEADEIYSFFPINYGEPNKPRLQAAPDGWIEKFGNNERTMLFHAISENRVKIAGLMDKVKELEKDPNE